MYVHHPSRVVVRFDDKEGSSYWTKMYPPGEYFDSPAKHARFAPCLAAAGVPTLDILGYGSENIGGYICYRGKREEYESLEDRTRRHPGQLGSAYAIIGDTARRIHAITACAGCGNVYSASRDVMSPASAAMMLTHKEIPDNEAYDVWVGVHMQSVLANYGGTGVLYEDELQPFRAMRNLLLRRFSESGRHNGLAMVHGDLQSKNILLTAALQPCVASVIDLDNISRLPVASEFTKLLGDDIGPKGIRALATFMENFPSTYYPNLEPDAATQATTSLLYDALYLRLVERMEAANFMLGEGLVTGQKPRCAQILDEVSMIMSISGLHYKIFQLEQSLKDTQLASQERMNLVARTTAYKMEALQIYVERRATMVQLLMTGQFDSGLYVPRDDYPYGTPIPMPFQQPTC